VVAARRIGIDLGGTKIEGVVLDDDNHIVFRERIATQSERGYAHIVDRIADVVAVCRQHSAESKVVGIGTPGSISARTGTMKNCNTTCLNGQPLRQDLESRLGLEVRLENDANLFTLAEATAGAGRGAALVFGIILGTGVGGGIVYRGELLRGPQHLTGEWGHHCLDPSGPPCYCGQRGCVEAFIAGPALERRYAELTGVARAMADIVGAYRSSEAAAVDIFGHFVQWFGRAVANVINILDPDVIVLGGGLSNIDELYTLGRDAVARCVFNDELRTPIVRHQLGDSAGVIGAALLV
jgi:fructokinase